MKYKLHVCTRAPWPGLFDGLMPVISRHLRAVFNCDACMHCKDTRVARKRGRKQDREGNSNVRAYH